MVLLLSFEYESKSVGGLDEPRSIRLTAHARTQDSTSAI